MATGYAGRRRSSTAVIMRYASLCILLSLSVPVAAEDKAESRVEVGGKTYRVMTRGTEIAVFPKALIARRSPDARDAMREAALKATGCSIGDPYWEGNSLRGKLVCPDGQPAPKR